jgi:hypothetical protein
MAPELKGKSGDEAIHAQKAFADVLLHHLHHALPGWGAAAERRDAQDELCSAAQVTAWVG